MKRITCSILIVLAASALYINSTDGVRAGRGRGLRIACRQRWGICFGCETLQCTGNPYPIK